MNKLILKSIGVDSRNRPVYEDQKGKLFKGTSLKQNDINGLCTVYGGFDGEPDTPLEYTKYKDYEITFKMGANYYV